jgi:hypothetical protein
MTINKYKPWKMEKSANPIKIHFTSNKALSKVENTELSSLLPFLYVEA